jgi:hypothetical protein
MNVVPLGNTWDRIEKLKRRNIRRREALEETRLAVEQIIARDELEIRNLEAQLGRGGDE